MNKREMDIQLVEACLLEKWIPMREGTFLLASERERESCVLCQVYLLDCICKGCPLEKKFGRCQQKSSPYNNYRITLKGTSEEAIAINNMCKVLEKLCNNLKNYL